MFNLDESIISAEFMKREPFGINCKAALEIPQFVTFSHESRGQGSPPFAILVQASVPGGSAFFCNALMTEAFVSSQEAEALSRASPGDVDAVLRALVAPQDRPKCLSALTGLLVRNSGLQAEAEVSGGCQLHARYATAPVRCRLTIRVACEEHGTFFGVKVAFNEEQAPSGASPIFSDGTIEDKPQGIVPSVGSNPPPQRDCEAESKSCAHDSLANIAEAFTAALSGQSYSPTAAAQPKALFDLAAQADQKGVPYGTGGASLSVDAGCPHQNPNLERAGSRRSLPDAAASPAAPCPVLAPWRSTRRARVRRLAAAGKAEAASCGAARDEDDTSECEVLLEVFERERRAQWRARRARRARRRAAGSCLDSESRAMAFLLAQARRDRGECALESADSDSEPAQVLTPPSLARAAAPSVFHQKAVHKQPRRSRRARPIPRPDLDELRRLSL